MSIGWSEIYKDINIQKNRGADMENQKVIKLNQLINSSYECFSFSEFLKLTILKLHELVMYDSGMFFCGISKDCSFFKPYVGGTVENYYKKQNFSDREEYLLQRGEDAGNEALVYKACDLNHGSVLVPDEPRNDFLTSQKDFHIACMRIIYKGQFMGEIYLHRSKDKPDFDEEDMFLLQLLQPHVSTVFNIIHTVTAVKYLETDSGRLDRKGLCLMDAELSITGGNVTGLEMLKMPTVFGSSVLYHVKEFCESIFVDQKGESGVIFRQTSLKTGNRILLVDIAFQWDRKWKSGTKFFITMNFTNEEQSMPEYKFKFTKREADIIDGVIQGKNNPQLAAALALSENTIKTHIQSIYRKVGANNRTELAYILLLNQK
jgi:DNA-binding CsgD family transcriptional regulator